MPGMTEMPESLETLVAGQPRIARIRARMSEMPTQKQPANKKPFRP